MKTVLFIAYYFPPAGGGGVQRPTKFVKYLRRFGWKSVVLTATEDSYVEYDRDLVRDIPEDTIIERVRPWLSKKQSSQIRQRTGTFLPAEKKNSRGILSRLAKLVRDWLLIPDSQILWVIPAIFRLKKIARKHNPDVIFATAPPYSILLLGGLARLLIKRPLFSDFRDPWAEYFAAYRKREPTFRKAIEKYLEKKVVGKSDRIIVPTLNMQSYFKEVYANDTQNKINLIYNGYDNEDYAGIRPKNFDKFTIVYTGKIISNFTSAVPFLRGLTEFLKVDSMTQVELQVKFIGLFQDQEASRLIHDAELTSHISLTGYLPHSECLAHQLGADVLLLVLNSGISQPITGKIFEYLRTTKPILAVVPKDSMAARLLDEIGMAAIVSPDEPQLIAKKIKQYYNGDKQRKIDDTVTRFERSNQTKQLATMMDEIVARSDASLSRT